jgi:hypothetical protein
MSFDEDEKRHVAYHESGHAVAQYLFGWDLLFVGIGRVIGGQEKWKGGSNGANKSGPNGAVIAYAGPLAEARSRGIKVNDDELTAGRMPVGMRDLGGWTSDAEVARRFAGTEATAPYVALARELVERDDVWRAISSLADELCNAARLQQTTLGEIPDDVRAEILPGFGSPAFGRFASYCYMRHEEAVQIVRASLGAGPTR